MKKLDISLETLYRVMIGALTVPILFLINILLSIKWAATLDLVILSLVLLNLKHIPVSTIRIKWINILISFLISCFLVFLIGPWGILNKTAPSYYILDSLETLISQNTFVLKGNMIRYQAILIIPTLIGKAFGFMTAKLALFLTYTISLTFLIIILTKRCKIKKKNVVVLVILLLFLNAPNFIPAFFLNAINLEWGVTWPTATLQSWFGMSLSQSTFEIIFNNFHLFLLTSLFFLYRDLCRQFKKEVFFACLLLFYSIPLGLALILFSIVDTFSMKENKKELCGFVLFLFFLIFLISSYYIFSIKNNFNKTSIILSIVFIFCEILFYFILLAFVNKHLPNYWKYVIYATFLIIAFLVQQQISFSIYNEFSLPLLLYIKYKICIRLIDREFWDKGLSTIVFTIYFLSIGAFTSLVTPLDIIKKNIQIYYYKENDTSFDYEDYKYSNIINLSSKGWKIIKEITR